MELQIGENARVDGQEKFWSGENYGWQSKEQHDKLKEEGKFKFGAQALDRIQSSAVNAIGGENLVKMAQGFSAVSEPLSKVLKFNPQLYGLYQAQENVGELTSQASGAASDALNVDKRITDTAAVAAEAFLTGGGPGATKRAAGKLVGAVDNLIPTPQLQFGLAGATNGRAVTQDLMSGPMQITLKNPDNIPKGIGQGSAASPEWKPQVKAFFDRREKLRAQYEDLFRRGSSKVGKKLKQIYNDVSTGMSRDPAGNPEAYRGESTSKKFDKYREVSEAEPVYLEGDNAGKVKYKQQHHLFSKQESHAFVERMIELGDEDDVLALFIMAEDMDATMGGRLRNMLNMEDTPHNITHQSRIFDGREVKSKDMKALVAQAKTTDELMEMFRKYVTENVRPSIDEAKALDKLYKDLKFNDDQINMLRDKNMRS